MRPARRGLVVIGYRAGRDERQRARTSTTAIVARGARQLRLGGPRHGRRTTGRPAARPWLGDLATTFRCLLRLGNSRGASGRDAHLGKHPRENQAGDQADRQRPSSCANKFRHHRNYTSNTNACCPFLQFFRSFSITQAFSRPRQTALRWTFSWWGEVHHGQPLPSASKI